MMADRMYRRALLPLALGAVVLLASPAAAQPANQGTPQSTIMLPPASGGVDDPPKYRMYLTVLVIGVLILGANAIPSKRGHQD